MCGVSDDEFGEKSVSVLLDGEESELTFIDHPYSEMSVSYIILMFTYMSVALFSLSYLLLVTASNPNFALSCIQNK